MTPLLVLIVALSVPLLAIGSVTEPGLVASSFGVAAICAWTGFSPIRDKRTSATRLARWALFGVGAYEAMQLAPLPPAALRVLSPRAAALWSGADAATGHGTRWHPITLDPHATIFMLATAVVVAVFYDAATRYAAHSAGRARLGHALVASVLLFDLVALAHPAFGHTRLYGVYAPQQPVTMTLPVLAPLLNSNHAAAVACIAPPLLAGIALESESYGARVLALVGAALSGAVAILTLSRGGMAVLTFEVIVMGAYALMRRVDARARLVGSIVALLTTGAGVAGATYIALEPILAEVRNVETSKLEVARRAYAMTRDFALTGAGRGAFTSTFPGYEDGLSRLTGGSGGVVRFTHAEHWPAQLLVDIGAPVGVAFVAALGIAFACSIRGVARRPSSFGAAVALLGLVIHDLADFSMEFAGVGIAAAALLAIVTTSQQGRATRDPDFSNRRGAGVAVGALLAVGTPLLLAPHWRHDVEDDAQALSERWLAGHIVDARSEIEQAIARHPAEPFFPLLAAVRVIRSADAAPLLHRAVQLGPGRAQTHYWLARWFLSVGRRGQAWAEYRQAISLASSYDGAVLRDMLAVGAPLPDIEAVAISEQALETAAKGLSGAGRTDDAAHVDGVLTEHFPPAVAARLRTIERARATGDIERARRLAADLVAAAPGDAGAYRALASLMPSGEEAEAVLERGAVATHQHVEVLEYLVRIRGGRLGLDAISLDIERLRTALLARDGAVYRVAEVCGDIERARGRPGLALQHYLDAAAQSPDGLASLERAAGLAESLGQTGIASTAWRRLSEAHPEDTRYLDAVERVSQSRERRSARTTVELLGYDAGL